MSQTIGHETASATSEKPWEKPAAADDIVDPIGDAKGDSHDLDVGAEQSVEEEEDVPLDVKFTDALSMLADGGHDYGSRPVLEEEPDEASAGDDRMVDLGEIDESSKDA